MPPNTNCNSVSYPDCTVESTIYGYYPNLAANAFFAAFFFLALAIQIIQGYRWRTWTFTLAMCLGCLAEGIGYVGRILLHYNPFSNTGFETQICCLIMAPAFLAAALYLLLKHIVLTFSPQYSLLPPKWYPWTFIFADCVALTLQGTGGGIAATSAGSNEHMLNIGTDLMITGIVGQVVTLLVVFAIVGDYSFRAYRGHQKSQHFNPETEALRRSLKFRIFLAGVGLAFLVIFTRCVYRIAEMAPGWANPIMQNETEFIVLDGVMCVIATAALTVVHPGLFFSQSALLKRGRPFAKTGLKDGDRERNGSEMDVEGVVREEVKTSL